MAGEIILRPDAEAMPDFLAPADTDANDSGRVAPDDNDNHSGKLRWSQRRTMVVLIVVDVLLVALVVWLQVTRQTYQPGSSGTPDVMTEPRTQSIAKSAIGIASQWGEVLDPEINEIIIVRWVDESTDTYQAFDLKQNKELWAMSQVDVAAVFATGGKLVVSMNGSIDIIDARDGKTDLTVPLGGDEKLVAAQSGIILTVREDESSICARALLSPDECVWQANVMSDQTVARIFAGSQLVDTGDGVLDFVTGRPVAFGADVMETKDHAVYYVGPSPERVLRYTSQTDSAGLSQSQYQLWDTQNDRALSDAIPGDEVVADATGSTFIITDLPGLRDLRIGAYSWTAGEQLWQTSLDTNNYSGSLCGNMFVATTWLNSTSPDQVVAIDLGSGEQVFSTEGYVLVFGQRMAYLQTGGFAALLTAYDCGQADFPALWSVSLSSRADRLYGAAGHLVAVSPYSGGVWVLNP